MRNKYNIRAIRKELDDYARNNAWTRFRSKLDTLQSNPELLQAIILAKSKLTSGSLLHAIVKLRSTVDSIAAIIMDLAISMATSVPMALHVQDSQLQTPLHIAVHRQQHPKMIQAFLELIVATDHQNRQTTNTNILTMMDKQGDTPLLKAARGNASYRVISLLLQYDIYHSSALIENNRKSALYYIASNELDSTCVGEHVIPRDLRLVLLETYFALQRSKGLISSVDESECWDFDSSCEAFGESSPQNGAISSIASFAIAENALCISLSIRALVACSHLLRKYAARLLQFLLERDSSLHFILTQEIDKAGNFMLHHVCMLDMHLMEDKLSAAATNALLLEQLLRLEHEDVTAAICHPNREGNLPIHLAIASQKGYVNALLARYPGALQHRNRHGELPLHIAMKFPGAETNTSNNRKQETITALWKAEPDTVAFRDGPSHLFPFQLAACSEWGPILSSSMVGGDDDTSVARATSGEDDVNDESSAAQWVSFILRLLLAAPQVIMTPADSCAQSEVVTGTTP